MKETSALVSFNRQRCPTCGRSKCFECGTTHKLTIHHIDGNHNNNDPKNKAVLCRTCHRKKHYGFVFNKQKNRYAKTQLNEEEFEIEKKKLLDLIELNKPSETPICNIHGAMLCYGNVLVKGKLFRIYRCIDGRMQIAKGSERGGTKEHILADSYYEVKLCEKLIPILEGDDNGLL